MYFLNALGQLAPRNGAIFLIGLVASLLMAACGGGGGSSTTSSSTSANTIVGNAISGSNVITVTVDSGPAGAAYQANRLFTNVTICVPGTSNCQTLDHVLVDTGSTGLRIIASALTTLSPQSLTKLTGANGKPLLNCARFLDGSYAWGPVASADVQLGGKTASKLPVQLIADSSVLVAGSTSSYNSSASACGSGNSGVTDTVTLGAKGILGIGHLLDDCGTACANSATRGYYYECTSTSTSGICTTVAPSTVPTDPTDPTGKTNNQVKNPVPLFNGDNNGLVVVLPAVTTNGGVSATTMQGSIVFGIDTQSNNSSAGATLMQLNSNGNFTATLNSVTMPASFLDTGSNGLFFDTALVQCVDSNNVATGFYCPASSTTFSGTFKGSNNVSKAASFTVRSPAFLVDTHVYPQLAGTLGISTAFDGGLPFFYGRNVFIGIEGASSNLGTGTYYGF